jgi:hypothetical protein
MYPRRCFIQMLLHKYTVNIFVNAAIFKCIIHIKENEDFVCKLFVHFYGTRTSIKAPLGVYFFLPKNSVQSLCGERLVLIHQ